MATETYDDHTTLTVVDTADKVVMWDNSGSVPYGITVANFKTSALGSGYVLADGSVPMTGSFNLAATGIVSTDGDSEHDFGRATVGYMGTVDVAAFSHRDHSTTTNYALSQQADGDTVINATTGKDVFFANNGTTAASIDNANLDLLAIEVTSNDADTSHIFGRALIGDVGALSDYAGFAHRDAATSTNYALKQWPSGLTFLNAASGGSISFTNADVTKATMSATAFDLLALSVTSNDADTAYTFGRATIGYDGTTSDEAIFSHRDHANSTGYAVSQVAAGEATINAPVGKWVGFKIGDNEIGRFDSTGFGIGEIAPEVLLHIKSSDLTSALSPVGDTRVIIESSGNTYITFRNGATNSGGIWFSDVASIQAGAMVYDHNQDWMAFWAGGSPRITLGSADISPNSDGSYDIGASGKRYQDIWATNATIQTSDVELKDTIKPSFLGLDFINKLSPVGYKWQPTKEQPTRRTHHGLLAQEVEKVLNELNIDSHDFAGFIKTEESYGLRYAEFIAPIIKAIQELDRKIEGINS